MNTETGRTPQFWCCTRKTRTANRWCLKGKPWFPHRQKKSSSCLYKQMSFTKWARWRETTIRKIKSKKIIGWSGKQYPSVDFVRLIGTADVSLSAKTNSGIRHGLTCRVPLTLCYTLLFKANSQSRIIKSGVLEPSRAVLCSPCFRLQHQDRVQ